MTTTEEPCRKRYGIQEPSYNKVRPDNPLAETTAICDSSSQLPATEMRGFRGCPGGSKRCQPASYLLHPLGSLHPLLLQPTHLLDSQVIKSTVGPWAQFGKVIGPNGGQPVITRYAIQQLTGEGPARLFGLMTGTCTRAALVQLARPHC